MKRVAVFCFLLIVATNCHACGDTNVYMAMDVAGYAVFGLFVLAVMILPFSVLLVTKSARFNQIILLLFVLFAGFVASIVLFLLDSHPYMIPGSIVLAVTSLFMPYLFLLVQSIKTYRS